MQIEEYPDRDMLAIDLANQLAGDLNALLHNEERVTFVVPGGTTPGPIFDDLCASDIDWSRVTVMLSDERWVPVDNERSNTGLIMNRLLVDRAAAADYVPLYAPAPQPEDVLQDLTSRVSEHLPIGVLLLGMGADMHTASIFPEADHLDVALGSDAPDLVAMRAAGAPEPRITFSARALNDAMRKHIVIMGDEKRAAIEKAAHLSAKEAPVQAVLRNAIIHWAP
jgi:6-phosphogluconolactonase